MPGSDADVVAAVDANFVGAWTLMAGRIAGGWTAKSAGVTIAATGIPLAPFNLVFITSRLRDPDRTIGRAIDRMDARGVPFILRVRTELRAELAAAAASGLSDAGVLPGMFMHRISDLPSLPPGVDVKRVADERTAAHHLAVAADAFHLPEDATAALVSEPLWHAPGMELYVAYQEGRPIATSALCVTGTVAGVYNVAVPAARRREGLGAAITAYAVRRGVEAYGASSATLQASEMGLPVYERMGFATVCRYAGFVSS